MFHFPNDRAAIAVNTVRVWRAENDPDMAVLLNVHSQENHELYRALLGQHTDRRDAL